MTEETATAVEPQKPKRKPAAKKAAVKKAPAKKAAAKKAVATKPRAASVSQNDITAPREGGASAAVWAIADKLSKQTRKPAARAAVLAEAEKMAVNAATAATQYARWRAFHGITGRAA